MNEQSRLVARRRKDLKLLADSRSVLFTGLSFTGDYPCTSISTTDPL